jgi:tRNA A-37 threonylcarbamoyl transferase component Bud32
VKVCPACGAEYAEDAAFCARDRTPLQPAESHPGLVGQIVAERYQVERRLGEGGMGEVYLARHLLMGRRCALKVMAPALSTNPDALGRFNREATNASRISHPNVCAVYDFGLTADGLVYLAMELVEGATLAALTADAPMPVPRATALVTQVAAGLQAAHDLGIVHRDLKLDNIMVTTGERLTVKLVDFGIAKAMEGVGDASQRVTRSGFVVGTPEYMAPEQLAGDSLDGRADQYALALVFYRLVTGQLPFTADSAQETLVQRLTSSPRPLASACPEARFPDGLQAVLDVALARLPRERYATVTDFARALEAVQAGDAASTRVLAAAGAMPPTRVTKASSRRRALAVAGTVVVVGALAALVSIPDRTADSPPESTADGQAGPAPAIDDTGATAVPAAQGPVATAPVEVRKPALPVVEAVDTLLPNLADLDVPDRRRVIVRNELAIYRGMGMRVSSQRRARAAALLSSTYLEDSSRDSTRRTVLMDSARLFARRAWQLNPSGEHKALLTQLDTVPR